jgi:hypothetical protein
MKRFKCLSLTTGLGVLVLLAMTACSQESDPDVPEPVLSEEFNVPDSSTALDEIWIFFADEPHQRLKGAKEQFEAKATDAAVGELHKASAFMKLESQRLGGQASIDLLAAAGALDSLAPALSQGTLTSQQRFEEPFAQAEVALCRGHLQAAAQDWRAKRYVQTGDELHFAALNIDQAAAWAKREWPDESLQAVKRAQRVAAELRQGRLPGAADVDTTLTEVRDLADAIDALIRVTRDGP